MNALEEYLAFNGQELLGKGSLGEVALIVKTFEKQNDKAPLLLFKRSSGQQIDLDMSGTEDEVAERFRKVNISGQKSTENTSEEHTKKGRGRPRLGVQGREVTLLPRHWEWLENQRGGASATLRRLVDAERKESSALDRVKLAQDATNRFMYAIGGNLAGFEEAIRALYAQDSKRFQEETQTWPVDIRDCAREFAAPVFV